MSVEGGKEFKGKGVGCWDGALDDGDPKVLGGGKGGGDLKRFMGGYSSLEKNGFSVGPKTKEITSHRPFVIIIKKEKKKKRWSPSLLTHKKHKVQKFQRGLGSPPPPITADQNFQYSKGRTVFFYRETYKGKEKDRTDCREKESRKNACEGKQRREIKEGEQGGREGGELSSLPLEEGGVERWGKNRCSER